MEYLYCNVRTFVGNLLPWNRVAWVAIIVVAVSSFHLYLKKQQRRYRALLPKYDEIPASILKHTANKKVLSELRPDTIIVGSGMGALATAAILTRCGQRVVVFEQHYTVGGSTHTYKTGGLDFDVGVHYVGGKMDSWASPFRYLFDVLSDGTLEWSRMSENFDVAYNASTGERLEMTGE